MAKEHSIDAQQITRAKRTLQLHIVGTFGGDRHHWHSWRTIADRGFPGQRESLANTVRLVMSANWASYYNRPSPLTMWYPLTVNPKRNDGGHYWMQTINTMEGSEPKTADLRTWLTQGIWKCPAASLAPPWPTEPGFTSVMATMDGD